MANPGIFTQWRQPVDECYPSEWQANACHWTHVRDEEKLRLYPCVLEQEPNQTRGDENIQWQRCQRQLQWTNLSPQNPWELRQCQENNRVEGQYNQRDQCQLQHNDRWPQNRDTWQLHRRDTWQPQHSNTWQQYSQQDDQSELPTLEGSLQASWLEQRSQRQCDDFKIIADGTVYAQATGDEISPFSDDVVEDSPEYRERFKRKSSDMKDVLEGYDTDDEEILPSCKRQRITVAAVERLLASFTISDNGPSRIDDFHLEGNFEQNDKCIQEQNIPLRADENCNENENNLHSPDSTHQTERLLRNRIVSFQKNVTTEFIYQTNSTLNRTDNHCGHDAEKHGVNHEQCDTTSELVEEIHQGTTGRVKVTFPDQEQNDEEENEEDKGEEVKDESEDASHSDIDEDHEKKFTQNSQVKSHEKISLFSFKNENTNRRNHSSEFQNEKNSSEESHCYSVQKADHLDHNSSNFDNDFYEHEKVNTKETIEHGFLPSNKKNEIVNNDDVIAVVGVPTDDNITSTRLADSTSCRTTTDFNTNTSSQIHDNVNDTSYNPKYNTSLDTTSNYDTTTSPTTNTSDDFNISQKNMNDDLNANDDLNTNNGVNTNTTAGNKRSMDGAAGALTNEGSSQKRVRKLKSGLRLCSNITCYIEQVLYNC